MLILKLHNKVTIMTYNKPKKNTASGKILDKSPETIHVMFNIISEKYDFMNNVMSFGTHNYVKYRSIQSLNIQANNNIIDLCCGTGDLARIIKQLHPDTCVTGIDISEKCSKLQKVNLQKEKFNIFRGMLPTFRIRIIHSI